MKRTSIKVCGVNVPVRVGNVKDCPDLADCYAFYDNVKIQIWVSDTTPPASRDFWVTHEALHALLDLSGALSLTQASLGVSEDDPRIEAWEEALVRILTPNILDLFGAP